MFRCTGYGECSMVFTRSEHLARHVRKHTGERPFKCHCGRLFSRLDNVRQHATTVHADDTELNTQMMKELTALHNQLSASTAQRQVAMGMVVKEDSDAPPRKVQAPTDPNKPRPVRSTKAKAKKARESAASENAAIDAVPEALAQSSLAINTDVGGLEGHHYDNSMRDRRSQADDEQGGSHTEFHTSDIAQPSPPPPPQAPSAAVPALQQRFMSGPYPPSSGNHYPPAASYNSYAYEQHQGSASSFAGYGNPSSPQNGLGAHMTSGSPPLRRRIAPPQPPVPAHPAGATSRFNAYNAPYSYPHHQVDRSPSAASHSSSNPPSPPGSSSGPRSGVTLPSISNLLPSPFGSTRDVSEDAQPPGFTGSEEQTNQSSQHAVESSGSSARTGTAHAGRGPSVMGSSNYSLLGIGNGPPYSSDPPNSHHLAAGMSSSAPNQTNAYDYPESHTHVNYDTIPYHDGSEAEVMQSATYSYGNSGHATLPSHQYVKHLHSQQGIPTGLAHHQSQSGSYHLAPPPHHGLSSYSVPGPGPNSFQDHAASSMGASDGHYYGAGTPRLYSPNSRESSERSSIGSWAPPPSSVHQNHAYQGASGMQMVDHHVQGMSTPRRVISLGGPGASPALEDNTHWRRAGGPQAR